MKRLAERVYQPMPKRRREPADGPPVGPALVVGRGLARRKRSFSRRAKLLFGLVWFAAICGLTALAFWPS